MTLVADVDGDLVSSPLAITEQMDRKILTVRANSTNFRSSTTTITLAYVTSGQSVIAITYTEPNSEADTYIYPIIILSP